MEDYIFIIIAIVLSIFGAINNKKKKEQAQAEAMEEGERQAPGRSRSVLEELLDDPFFQSESEEQPVPQVIKPFVPQKKEPVRYEPRTYFKDKTKTPEKPKPMMESLDKSRKIRNSIRSDFSLRKAVIYNEILNRKY